MKVTSVSWRAAGLCIIFFAFTARAQNSFVQITDPHIFDADQPTQSEVLGKNKQKERMLESERAFKEALQTINQQSARGADYEFIVITGDLGIAHWKGPLWQAAKKMADWLRISKIERFLFVPGNNDVGNSQEKIEKYREFLAKLKKLLPDRVVDLCEQPFLDKKGRLFIGHNNASYRSDNKQHLSDLLLLRERISAAGNSISQIYIFFHIAGIDDPHLIEKDKPDPKQTDYPYSAWGVNNEIRQIWNSLFAEPSVKGVFAGHFHTSDRMFYQRPFTWIRGRYPRDVVEKTFLCPPLSAKYQWEKSSRARGFQIVTLDQEGHPSLQVYWYENGQFSNRE